MKQKMAFIHIPKTAGTSFTLALRSAWQKMHVVGTHEEFGRLSNAALIDLDLIAGHFYMHQMEGRGLRNFDVVTVLRDPFERLFSAYRFSRQCVEAGLPVDDPMALAARVSFGDWATSAFRHTLCHTQLYICGLGAEELQRPQTVSYATLLQRAKARFDRIHVGTVSQLVDLLTFVFKTSGNGEPPPPLQRVMVSIEMTLDEAGLTRAQRVDIDEMLRPDNELFAYAHNLLAKRMDSGIVSIPLRFCL